MGSLHVHHPLQPRPGRRDRAEPQPRVGRRAPGQVGEGGQRQRHQALRRGMLLRGLDEPRADAHALPVRVHRQFPQMQFLSEGFGIHKAGQVAGRCLGHPHRAPQDEPLVFRTRHAGAVGQPFQAGRTTEQPGRGLLDGRQVRHILQCGGADPHGMRRRMAKGRGRRHQARSSFSSLPTSRPRARSWIWGA